jgi:hypothetical protein
MEQDTRAGEGGGERRSVFGKKNKESQTETGKGRRQRDDD